MTNGWQNKRLSEVAEISAGNSAPQADSDFENGSHPFFRTADAGRIRFGDIFEARDHLNAQGIRGLRKYPKGTILFPKSGASTFLNHRVMLGVEGYVSSHLATIVADKTKIEPRYLLYFLCTIETQSLVQDHSYPSINLPIIAGISVEAPSLSEQQRIVDILDESFDNIATVLANTDRNLQNVHTLFKSYTQSVFGRSSLGRIETTLGNVCQFENGDRGKNYPHRSEYVESGVPWINTGHIQPDGTLSQSEMNFISRDKYNSLRSGKIQPGDVVYCLRGATLGKTAVVNPLTIGAVASSLVIIRPHESLDSRFLYSFLTSPVGQDLIKRYKNGAAQPNLGAKSVAKYPISLPSLAEQKVIVQKLDEFASETQQLAAINQNKLNALDTLKKSLLHRAFSGQL